MGNVLVTGGTGFIGSHTVEQLLAEGKHVRCLVRPSRRDLGWLTQLPVEIVRADVFSPSSLEPVFSDVDVVIHLAGVTKAKRASEFQLGNAVATRNLLEAASRASLKRFCFVSSLTVNGPSPDGRLIDETSPCLPITEYGRSKLEAEMICRSYMTKLPIVIVRPPAVYGPRDTDILGVFKAVARRIRPFIGSPNKSLSMIYAPELARGIVAATYHEAAIGETYFLTDPDPYSYPLLIEKIAALVGTASVRIKIPAPVVYAVGGISEFLNIFRSKPDILNIDKARDLVQDFWVCSGQKVKDHVGFVTRVGIDEGLRKTFNWYKDQKWL